MVTVMTVPNGLSTAVTVSGGTTLNGLSVTWFLVPSWAVPLIVTLWLPKGTEVYVNPSKPVIKVQIHYQVNWLGTKGIHRNMHTWEQCLESTENNFYCLQSTNAASSSWHVKLALPEINVICSVMFCSTIDVVTLKVKAVDRRENSTHSCHIAI